MNSLSKNLSANILSGIWLTVLSLVLTPVYIWFLGIESYGLIGFYLSWITILGMLDVGISATANREIAWLAARPDEAGNIPILLRSLEIFYWGVVLILGALILAGAWIFGEEWFKAKDLQPELIRDALMLMAVSLVFQVPSGLYVAGLMGLQRQVECSGLLILFGSVRGLGAVIVLWWIGPDIRVFFLWQILASVLQTGIIRWWLWRKVHMDGHPARFSLERLHSVKGFAGGMFLIVVLSALINQGDKMILSRMVSLEIFGFYMLAWAVASGLSRVATPVSQAFGPRFTELVSRGEDEEVAKHLRLASQLMSVLTLPPAALIVFCFKPILFIWTGDQAIAEGSGPLLAVLVLGTVLTSASYPPLATLYSRKQLKPVINVMIGCTIVLLPLLVVSIVFWGAMGAAFIWGLYGLVTYLAFQAYGWREIPNTGLFLTILRDFVSPCAAAVAVAGLAGYWLNDVDGKVTFVALLSFMLIVGWFAALLVCRGLFKTVMEQLKGVFQ